MIAVPPGEPCGELRPPDLTAKVPHVPAGRRVELTGCVNFRDVGGYRTADGDRVRTGRLYRSDGLHELSIDDVRRVRDELGIRTVFDLRTPAELELMGTSPLYDDGAVRHVHTPVFVDVPDHWRDAPGTAWTPRRNAEVYADFLELGRANIVAVVRALGEPSTYPALVHCVAGKDRTGVVCALLLDALGVGERDLVDDYMLTYEVIRDFPMHAESMVLLFETIRHRHRSAAGYLRDAGVSDEELAALRAQLLD